MNGNGGEAIPISRDHLTFAYYVTGHGFGHATRVVEVVRHLIAAGHVVHVVTRAPDFVFTSETQSPNLQICKAFKALLTAGTSDEQLRALGDLLYQCQYSYSDCGLGSYGTDKLVALVQQVQHRKSSQCGGGTLFGAKITGGGSVCVIGRNCGQSSEEILEIQQRYKDATGYPPFIFDGSSPGAGKFGYLKLRHRPLLHVYPEV